MKKNYMTFCMLFLIVILSQTVFPQVHFTARLTGSQEVPSDSTTAAGTAAFTLTDEGLTYIIAVDSIAKITGAHFHSGAIGDTGRVLKSILPSFRGNVAYGIWKTNDTVPLSKDLINALLNGNIYVNVHTAAHPTGEIRGQVCVTSGTSLKAYLTGNQEPAPVISIGSGTGAFLLTDAGLAYTITINGLSGVTGASLHIGELGVSGSVIKPLNLTGNKAVGVWSKTDASVPLTERLITAILLDSLYINVTTQNHPEGEIRGQIRLEGGIGFYANLTGAQELPPVTTLSKATGNFILTHRGLVFNMTINSADSIIAAHFFKGPEGMIGELVRTITEISGKRAAGIWKFNDAIPLTSDLLAELMKGNIYINLLTEKNRTGEIRGQLKMVNGTMFTANLTPFQIRSGTPKNQTGRGTANFYFTNEGLAYNITVTGTDTIKSSHIHIGAIGVDDRLKIVKGVSEFVRYTANGLWKYSDTLQALSSDLIDRLFKGELYLNIRTKVDTLGGLRGQILLANGTTFRADLTGSQEVPQVATNAKGTATFALTNEGLSYNVTVDSIVISAAHFHMGDIGAAGGVVKDVINNFILNSAAGVWRTTGTQPLTADLIKALMTGKLYLSVHSPSRPMGELRGQILLNGGWGFSAHMNGFQEVPGVNTAARGNASFTLTPGGLIYDMTMTGLQPTAVRFHKGPQGQNGSVVQSVNSTFKTKTVSDVWLTSGKDSLNFDNIAALLTGGIYVNAATSKYSSGEIRGQVVKLVKDAVVSVRNQNNTSPESFRLEQNYPNPFNPATSIKFSIPVGGFVNLTVYNMLGEKVATLLDAGMKAGSYEVRFDASHLASGIYLYRLSAGGNVSVKKMMLLK